MNAHSVLRAVLLLALAHVPRALTAQRATTRLDSLFDRREAQIPMRDGSGCQRVADEKRQAACGGAEAIRGFKNSDPVGVSRDLDAVAGRPRESDG